MAEPKLEVDKRIDRIELAIDALTHRLKQMLDDWTDEDSDEIKKVIWGDKTPIARGE